MKRIFIIASILFGVLSFSSIVLAQSTTPEAPNGNEDWCYYFDFTQESYSTIGTESGWFIQVWGDGWVSGSGYLSETNVITGIDQEINYLRLTLPDDYFIYEMGVKVNSTESTLPTHSDDFPFTLWKELDTFGANLQQFSSSGFPMNDTWFTVPDEAEGFWADNVGTFNNPRANNPWYIEQIYLSGAGDPPYPTLENICEGNDDLVQPLQALDRNAHYDITDTIGSAITGIVTRASNENANVRAVVDGTIISIEELDPSQCDSYYFGSGASTGSFDCPVLFNNTLWNVSTNLTHVVTIESSAGNRFVQIASQVNAFAVEGQTVEAGCWLGKVVSAQNPLGDEIALTSSYSEDDVSGFSELAIDGIPPAPEPPESAPCYREDGFEECLGDYNLKDQSNWITNGSVLWGGDEIVMTPGSELIGSFVLDASREPELVIGHWTHHQSVVLQLGQTSISTVFMNGKATIPGGSHQPNGGQFYTIRVENISSGLFRLDYICVRHTKNESGGDIPPDTVDPDDLDPGETPPPDNPPENEQTCTFVNNSFDDGTGSWTVSSGVEGGTGAIHIPNNGTISQNITTTETRTLSVIASVWAYNTYNPDPTDTSTILLEYDSGSGYTAIETKTLGEFASRNNTLVMQATVTAFSGSFSLRPTLTGVPSDVRGLTIKSVCMNEDDTIITDDEGEIEGGIFTAQCNTQIVTASGDNLFTWIPWLWSHLNKFFQCDLMILLNQIYQLGVDAYTLAGWSIRYGITTVDLSVDWFGQQFVPWLGGYLSNISPGNITVQQDEQCNNLFCAIVALFDVVQSVLDIFNAVLDLVINVVGAIIEVGLQIVGLLFEFFNSAKFFLEAIVNSWLNAPPIVNPYIPTCSINPQQNGMCIFLWLLENTLLSGTGALIIPLLYSYGGIMWILWGVKEFKKAIVQAGGSL